LCVVLLAAGCRSYRHSMTREEGEGNPL